MKPALILLAAGASRRLGEPKALARIGGRTVLERLLAAGAGLDAAPPILVTGAHHAELAAAAPPGLELLHNPRWSAGRTGGLALAMALRPGRDLCIAPADTPLVAAATFAALAAAWEAAGAPANGWLSPRHAGRHGHPVLIGAGLAAGLPSLPPDEPLRTLRDRAAPLFDLEVPDPAVLDDLDTPTDLERLRARVER